MKPQECQRLQDDPSYREEFKPTQGGVIGITLNGDAVEPFDSSSAEDIDACTRKLEFSIGWFADPIYKGQYPESKLLRMIVGPRARSQ